MATLAKRGTSVVTTSGTTWASTSSCIDGTVGANDATYGTWTNTTSGGAGYIEIGGYDFSSIPADASIVHVTVSPRHYLSASTTRMASITVQAYDSSTTIGSGLTATKQTTVATDALNMDVLPTVAQLKSANFKVRMTWVRAAVTTACVANLDFIDITVTYMTPITDPVIGVVDSLAVEVSTAVVEGGAGLTEPAPTVSKTEVTIQQTATSPDLNITDTGTAMSHLLTVVESTGMVEPAPTVNATPTFGNEYDLPLTDPNLNITDTGSALSHLLTVTEPVGLAESAPVVTKTTDGGIFKTFDDTTDLADYGADRTYVETQTDTALDYNDLDGFGKNLMPSGYNTIFGVALAGGGTSSFTSPDATLASTAGIAIADGEVSVLGSGYNFVSLNGRAIAGGNTSVMGISATFGTTVGAAAAAGVLGRLWTPDGRMATVVGAVTASGRIGALLNGAPNLTGSTLNMIVSADAFVSQDPFQTFNPLLMPTRSVEFEVEPWRVHDGVPVADATYVLDVLCDAELGASSVLSPYVSAGSFDPQVNYRWLAVDYNDPEWLPSGISTGWAEARSWDDVRDQFTWSKLRAITWDEMRLNEADPTVPNWSPDGVDSPVLNVDYAYWRVDNYVTAPIVAIRDSAWLALTWEQPPTNLLQTTVLAVIVPHVPTSESFTILKLSDEIHVDFHSNSTLTLVVGNEVITTVAIAARSRPNEPIVVALSLLEATSAMPATLLLGVMDITARTLSVSVPTSVPLDGIVWRLGQDGSNFDILEIDMRTDLVSPSALSSLMSTFDRVYGVTVQ